MRGRVYLAGRTGLYRSDDWGQSWVGVGAELQAEHASALLVPSGRPDQVHVVAGGVVWTSADGARSWKPRGHGLPSGSIEVVGLDPSNSSRLWAVAGGQVFQTDDQGQRWRPVGQPLPERPVVARAIAVSGRVILIATDRGVYRSPDDGERWELPSENLPAHLEAPLLALDPRSPTTLYAGFALMPYDELSRRAVEGGRPFGRLALTNLVGAAAFLALLFLGAGMVLRRLARTYYRAPFDRPASSTARPNPSAGPHGAMNQAMEHRTAPRRSRHRWLGLTVAVGIAVCAAAVAWRIRAVGLAGVRGVQAAESGRHPGQHRRGA